jgi:hypothetical protein
LFFLITRLLPPLRAIDFFFPSANTPFFYFFIFRQLLPYCLKVHSVRFVPEMGHLFVCVDDRVEILDVHDVNNTAATTMNPSRPDKKTKNSSGSSGGSGSGGSSKDGSGMSLVHVITLGPEAGLPRYANDGQVMHPDEEEEEEDEGAVMAAGVGRGGGGGGGGGGAAGKGVGTVAPVVISRKKITSEEAAEKARMA